MVRRPVAPQAGTARANAACDVNTYACSATTEGAGL